MIYIIIPVYNPDIQVLKANILEFIKCDLCKVIIYMNSEIEEDFKKFAISNSKIILLGSERNDGLAVAYNNAINFIKLNSALNGFLLILDQDSFIGANDILDLHNEFLLENSDNIILSCSVISERSKLLEKKHGSLDFFFYDRQSIKECRGSGSFFSLRFFETRNFNENLFVDYVDWELCWRYQSGIVIKSSNICINHKQGDYYPLLFGCKVLSPSPHRLGIQAKSTLYLLNKSYIPFIKRAQLFLRIYIYWPFKSLLYVDRSKRLKKIFF